MNITTDSVVKNLKTSGIKIVSIDKSKDVELEDDSVTLENGYYLTLNPLENYLMLWRQKDAQHEMVCDLSGTNYPKIIKRTVEHS
jgi:hypothetical protein